MHAGSSGERRALAREAARKNGLKLLSVQLLVGAKECSAQDSEKVRSLESA